MRRLIWLSILLAGIWSCGDKKAENNENLGPNVHKVIALEKVNTSNYTYLLVNENGVEKWVALPLTEVNIGDEYYYGTEMLMERFESKELGKTFDKVYFIEGISTQPPVKAEAGTPGASNPQPAPMAQEHKGSNELVPQKMEVKIEQENGSVSIETLMKNKDKYAGKKIKIKGVVAKFSPEIMGKNWVHLQDGSEASGKFDLTITTKEMVNMGDIVTFEGVITLNKDLGSGYKYEVLMEDAVVR